jgi:16S rRNA C1402 (ribose-2'-O) methylase RsmI
MTKQFERVERGYLSELIPRFTGKPVKGEVTLVIAGSNPKFAREEPDVLFCKRSVQVSGFGCQEEPHDVASS